MKTLPQIAFDFAADKDARQDQPGEASAPVQPHQAGVGVRLKHPRKEAEKKETENAEAAPESTMDDASAQPAPEQPQLITQPIIEATFLEISSSGKPKSTRGRKSLKQVSAEADLIEIPADDELFSKQYYTMGEVAAMFRVNQSLLRFWEAEFDILKPRKNKKGDRYFRPIDIKNLHLIYNLLRQRKYTIEGAKEFLKSSKKADARFEAIRRLQDIRAFLLELKAQI
jgi:DNA-binding transcriptional MerR regulator